MDSSILIQGMLCQLVSGHIQHYGDIKEEDIQHYKNDVIPLIIKYSK
jgi:hypothetical protein